MSIAKSPAHNNNEEKKHLDSITHGENDEHRNNNRNTKTAKIATNDRNLDVSTRELEH